MQNGSSNRPSTITRLNPRTAPSQTPALLLRRHLSHLSLKLSPLVSVTACKPHPDFPRTLLHYHILTEAQLDSLAEFYHQQKHSTYSLHYPAPIVGRWLPDAGIEEKRRRFGRFVGLKGCDSPVAEGATLENREMERWVGERLKLVSETERNLEAWREKGF